VSALVALLTLAQVADLATALCHGALWYERNPVGAGLLTEPLAAMGTKAALVALLVAVYVVLGRGRLATAVVATGAIAGAVGAWSNL
jgi:hypothetical protein